jgi:hypothetical protein
MLFLIDFGPLRLQQLPYRESRPYHVAELVKAARTLSEVATARAGVYRPQEKAELILMCVDRISSIIEAERDHRRRRKQDEYAGLDPLSIPLIDEDAIDKLLGLVEATLTMIRDRWSSEGEAEAQFTYRHARLLEAIETSGYDPTPEEEELLRQEPELNYELLDSDVERL